MSAPPPAGGQPPAAEPGRPAGSPPPASLRRELAAIAVLYAILSILPLLIGLAFAP